MWEVYGWHFPDEKTKEREEGEINVKKNRRLITDLYRQTVKTVTKSEQGLDGVRGRRRGSISIRFRIRCVSMRRSRTPLPAPRLPCGTAWTDGSTEAHTASHSSGTVAGDRFFSMFSMLQTRTAAVRLNSGRWRTEWSRRSPKRWRTGSGNCRRNGLFCRRSLRCRKPLRGFARRLPRQPRRRHTRKPACRVRHG